MTPFELVGGVLLVVGGLAVAAPERTTVPGEGLFSAGTGAGEVTARNVTATRLAGVGPVAFGLYDALRGRGEREDGDPTRGTVTVPAAGREAPRATGARGGPPPARNPGRA